MKRNLLGVALAALTLCINGCGQLPRELLWTVDYFWGGYITSVDDGTYLEKIRKEQEAREHERMERQFRESLERMNQMFLAGMIRSQSGNRASVDIVPNTTLFATTLGGAVLQLDTTVPDPIGPVRRVETGQQLKAGVASPGNEFLYLISTGSQTGPFSPSVRLIDLSTFQPAAPITLPNTSIPSSAAITPDGKYLYVAGPLRAQTFTDPVGVECHVIDTATRAVVKTLNIPGNVSRPELVAGPDGGRIFLTTAAGVAVIDVLTQTVSHVISEPDFAVSGGPAHIAVNPAGTFLYMAPVRGPLTTNPNPPPQLTRLTGVAVYDLATSTQVAHVPVSSLNTMVMAVSADGAYLGVNHIVPDPNTGRNDFPSLEIIRLADNKLVGTYPWTGPRNVPLTVNQLLPIPAPPQ